MPAGKGSSYAVLRYLLSQDMMSRLCLRIIQSAVQAAGQTLSRLRHKQGLLVVIVSYFL